MHEGLFTGQTQKESKQNGTKKKVLIVLVTLGVICAIVAAVMVTRSINTRKYATLSTGDTPSYYADPTNLSLYPRDITGVTVTPVDYNAAQGFHLVPDNKSQKGVVVVYGGSEGTPGYNRATLFAQNGYEVLALFMFGQKNQPKTLSRIPLEQFADVLSYLDSKKIDRSTLTVVGASKGAEYALNLATKYKDISSLILISPSAYTFNGLDFADYGSSWTYKGKELPFVDVTKTSFTSFIRDMIIPTTINTPISYRAMYSGAVERDSDLASATIPVDKTNAAILILAGEDDRMWDSPGMAEVIKKQRPENTTVQIYPGAGHTLGGGRYIATPAMTIDVGGTDEANAKAAAQHETLMLATLHAWHEG